MQTGTGSGNVQFNAATWSIAEGAAFGTPSFAQTACTVATAVGDMDKFTVTCPDLSTTGAGQGRSMRVRISRDGSAGADTLTTPIQVTESKLRWTLTSACPAP